MIRVDSAPSFTGMKFKSFLFGVLEGYLKDNVEFVDVEETL